MAFTLVQAQNVAYGLIFQSETTETVTFGASVTTGNLIVVYITSGSRTVSSVTDTAGSSYSQTVTRNGQNGRINIWRAIAAGAFTQITVTISGTDGDNHFVRIEEWSGNAATQSPVTNNAGVTGNTVHASGSVTPNTADNIVVYLAETSQDDGSGWTADGAFTRSFDARSYPTQIWGTGYVIQASATAQEHNATSTTSENSDWVIAAFDGAAAGGEVSWTPKHDLDKSHGPARAVRLNGVMQ